jgi:hypothetical protein
MYFMGDAPKDEHHHSEAEERRIREAALDETIRASFPASDPPSTDPNPDQHDALDDAGAGDADGGGE